MTLQEFTSLKAGDKVLSCCTLTGIYSGLGNVPGFVVGHSVELTVVSNRVFTRMDGVHFKICSHPKWMEGIPVNCEDIVVCSKPQK